MPNGMSTVIYPQEKNIRLVNHAVSDDGYSWINKLIGCSMFTFVRLYENGDGVYLDDEGLYVSNQYFWIHKNYPTPLAGIGIFAGIDDEGETIPPRTYFTQIFKDVRYIGTADNIRYETQKANIINDDYRPSFFKGEEYA